MGILSKLVGKQKAETEEGDWRAELEKESRKNFERETEAKYKAKYSKPKPQPKQVQPEKKKGLLSSILSRISTQKPVLDKMYQRSMFRKMENISKYPLGIRYKSRSHKQISEERKLKLLIQLEKARAIRQRNLSLNHHPIRNRRRNQTQNPQNKNLARNYFPPRRVYSQVPAQPRPPEKWVTHRDAIFQNKFNSFPKAKNDLWKIVQVNGQFYQVQPDLLNHNRKILKPIKAPGWL